MLQFKRWLITIFSLVLIVAALGFVKFTQIKEAIAFGESFPEPSETVQAVLAQWSSFQPTVTLTGEIRSKRSVNVRNEVEGILTKVNVGSGSLVNKGDILAQFNVDSEMAQLDAIKAQIQLAKLDVKRFADLVSAKASSKEPLDRAEAQLLVAQAQARAIEANIAKKTLIAPFSGRTSIHDLEVGTYLPANTLLVNITAQDSTVWVDFNLPQIYANIDLGTDLEIVAKNTGSTPIPATLVALNQQLNTSSRTLQARAEISNAPKTLRPGIVVSVKLPTGPSITAVPLPNEAIRYDAFGSYVFGLSKNDRGDYIAVRKPVTVVSKEADTSYISTGIEANELIATIGSAKLLPDLLTYVVDE